MKPKRYGFPLQDIDKKTIKDNYQTKSDAEIAPLLERTENSVRNFRVSMGLFGLGRGKRFTKYEIDFVKLHYHSMTDQELSDKLNRSIHSIAKIRIQNKLRRQRAYVDRFVGKKVEKMRNLIYLCEITTSPYIKDKYKEQLRKLSGL